MARGTDDAPNQEMPAPADRWSGAAPRAYDGPRWRVAVLRADGSRARRAADEVIDQLRAAGCMAVEHDPARIDPFLDVDAQWGAAVDADAYDVVVSVGELLPAAVALATVAGAPVARIAAAPGAVPASLPRIVSAARVRTVPTLDVAADRSRHITTGSVEITSDAPVVASLRLGDQIWSLAGTGWSAGPSVAAVDELMVSSAAGDEVTSAHQLRVDAPDGTVQLEVDGRSRRVRSLTIRTHPLGLRLLELPPAIRR